MASSDSAKLGSIKTEILVAWIFALLVVLGWLIGFIFYAILLGAFPANTCTYYGCYANPAAGFFVVLGILFFIWMIPAILVFRKLGQMRGAANRGDIGRLKQLNSVGWAIVGLLFAGVIPGIMMLIAHGAINELGSGTMGTGGTMGSEGLDRLAKLKGLLDSGAITKEEYDAQKETILHPGAARPSGVEDELRKLKSLHDSGALSDAEYEAQRKKILSGM